MVRSAVAWTRPFIGKGGDFKITHFRIGSQ